MLKIISTGIICCLISPSLASVDIWVSPEGNDRNPGTKEEPLASLLIAQRKARELRRLKDPSIEGGIRIILKDGKYILNEPVFFRPEDSGTEGSPTIIMAAENAKPVISGGVPIERWQRVQGQPQGLPDEATGKLWVADLPRVGGQFLAFRQLWINDRKAVRASTFDNGPLRRIIAADKMNESFTIQAPEFELSDPRGVEFFIHQWWAIANLRVRNIERLGREAKITFEQPESRIEFEHPWPAPFIDEEKKLNGNSAYFFINALEFLDHPGEWYADLEEGKVYYWPRERENMEEAKIIAPFLETLVNISGTLDRPVSNITFKGLEFAHTTWMRPSIRGHVPLQAGFSLLDAYKLKIPGTPDKAGLENQAWLERQPAGVLVAAADHIVFDRCKFRHMAATGLDFVSGTNHNMVAGNVFQDIGGTAIQIGFFGDDKFEAHWPYNPADEREVCHHERITNNLITDVTNEDWGCVGISVGYAHDVTIDHNEVSDINYSGICVGWGWTKTVTCMKNNKIIANHIHHFAKNMYDVGGIYTLSAQPNTEIRANSIHHLEKAPYAHIPEHYQYIYFDEGSSYIRAVDNWTEKDKFFSNSPGPGNEWKNNGPQVSVDIKQNAGLEADYQDLMKAIEKP